MIKLVKQYNIGQTYQQIRTCPVCLGNGKYARLFVHANTENLDPWCESMAFPKDTLKLTLISEETGEVLWTKDLGEGIIPGIWFEPVISFDLDKDGVDEIFLLGNKRPARPFTFEHRTLERIDPISGEVTGQWPWPQDMVYEKLSYAYRFYLVCGYAHGEPVLVCTQGTYTEMHLQGYGPGMEKKWDVTIMKGDPGAKAAHHTIVFDINDDGVDELFWGERVLSMEDGHEIACGDRDLFHAHSDILTVFEDPEDGKRYIYTCREGQDADHVSRVVTYDDKMNVVWRWPEGGHMHTGWVAAIGENRRNVAMAMSLTVGLHSSDQHHSDKIFYYFDAVTGKTMEPPLPYDGNMLTPIDINGDGYSEFLVHENDRGGAEVAGNIIDRNNQLLGHVEGHLMTFGKLIPEAKGQQMLMSDGAKGLVYLYADDEAIAGPCDQYPEFHANMQHMMASGYNAINGNFGI